MLNADRYYPYNPWVDPGIRGTTHGSTCTCACSTPCTYLGRLTRPPEGENRPSVMGQRMVAQE